MQQTTSMLELTRAGACPEVFRTPGPAQPSTLRRDHRRGIADALNPNPETAGGNRDRNSGRRRVRAAGKAQSRNPGLRARAQRYNPRIKHAQARAARFSAPAIPSNGARLRLSGPTRVRRRPLRSNGTMMLRGIFTLAEQHHLRNLPDQPGSILMGRYR